MGVARGRCLAAGVVAGVLACALAVAPSASAADVSVSSGAGVSSGGVVQAPSAGSPSGSPSASGSPSVSGGLGLAGSPSWPAGVPDPPSWLRNVKVSDVGAHTADVSFDWDLSYLLNGKQSGETSKTTQLKDEKRIDTYSWKVGYAGSGLGYGGMCGWWDDFAGCTSFDLPSLDLAKDVDGVCFTIGVGRATSVTPTGAKGQYDLNYRNNINGSCGGGTADDKLTASDYQRIYGTHTEQSWYGTVTGQAFYRYSTLSLAEAGAKPGTLKGHYDMALIGLDANTLYGNTKGPDSLFDYGTTNWWSDSFFDAVNGTAGDLYEKGVRKNTKIDVRRLKVGVALQLKDSSKAVQQCKTDPPKDKNACNVVYPVIYRRDQPDYVRNTTADGAGVGVGGVYVSDDYLDFATAVVPDFRTGVEPVVASSTSGLPASARGRISVDAGVVKQGSVARFYVDGLKAAARGKADANSLFWYAYIYSSPQRLSGPDGAPYVSVKKDPKGRYYFDAIVPAGLKAGSHTVSLVDGQGACQGWTPVTVAAGDTVVMFRLYNRFTGEHFYTSSLVERDSLVKAGWRDEGVGWYSGGSVKVLREYNRYARTGTHNYTADPREDAALVKAGWRSEGTGWYAVKAR